VLLARRPTLPLPALADRANFARAAFAALVSFAIGYLAQFDGQRSARGGGVGGEGPGEPVRQSGTGAGISGRA